MGGEGGSLDFAGGSVVHISSGVSALAASLVLGKRHKAEREEGMFDVACCPPSQESYSGINPVLSDLGDLLCVRVAV